MERYNENKFDFYAPRKKIEPSKKKDLKKFKTMGLASLVIAAIFATGFTIKLEDFDKLKIGWEQRNKEESIEKSVRATPTAQIDTLMDREEKILKTMYEKNKELLTNYAQYSLLMEALHYEAKHKTKYEANEKIYKDSIISLQKDRETIEGMLKGEKKYLKPENLKTLETWGDKNTYRQYVYAYALIELQSDIEKDLDFLQKNQKEINKEVSKRNSLKPR